MCAGKQWEAVPEAEGEAKEEEKDIVVKDCLATPGRTGPITIPSFKQLNNDVPLLSSKLSSAAASTTAKELQNDEEQKQQLRVDLSQTRKKIVDILEKRKKLKKQLQQYQDARTDAFDQRSDDYRALREQVRELLRELLVCLCASFLVSLFLYFFV